MFLRCPFCTSPTKYRSTENCTLVIQGNPVCHRPLCREKASQVIAAQSAAKARELGICLYQLPLRLDGG